MIRSKKNAVLNMKKAKVIPDELQELYAKDPIGVYEFLRMYPEYAYILYKTKNYGEFVLPSYRKEIISYIFEGTMEIQRISNGYTLVEPSTDDEDNLFNRNLDMFIYALRHNELQKLFGDGI